MKPLQADLAKIAALKDKNEIPALIAHFNRIGNWVEDRVDVGFRIGRSAEEGVIARRLFTLQLIITLPWAGLSAGLWPSTSRAASNLHDRL